MCPRAERVRRIEGVCTGPGYLSFAVKLHVICKGTVFFLMPAPVQFVPKVEAVAKAASCVVAHVHEPDDAVDVEA
jgi:hypothetical protein